jgi:aspartate aminotransferase/aminotransferase
LNQSEAEGRSHATTAPNWVSRRAEQVDASGIRKVFDLAAKLKDPINLSIGLPDFDVALAALSAPDTVAGIRLAKKLS